MERYTEIRQHNAITTARYEYSELQLDIFFYLLSKIRKDQSNDTYEIVVKDLSAITGKEYKYSYLKKATEQMGSRMFEVDTSDSYKQIWMFERVEYKKGEGRIEIEFTKSIKPYLFDLKDNFTSFQLLAALKLSSKYAKRIYTICSQWKDIGQTKKVDILDFKKMLFIIDEKGNEQYEKISAFQKYVLNEAVNQINEHTDLRVSYDLEKKGRSFKNIIFNVTSKNITNGLPYHNLIIESKDDINKEKRNNVMAFLESINIKDSIIIDQIIYSNKMIDTVNKFAYELQIGKIKAEKNKAGLLLTILGIKNKKQTN